MANLNITCPPIVGHKGVNNITTKPVQCILVYHYNNRYNVIQYHNPYISYFFNSINA